MFTGIITGLGEVLSATPTGKPGEAGHGYTLAVRAPAGYLADVQLGDSIALNGACMTVTEFDAAQSHFNIDISAESIAKTARLATPGTRLNLEKALRPQDRLGGHLVSGHVDGVGRVTRLAPVGESFEFCVLAPRELARYLAYKGSITVNGVSLTVNRVSDGPEGAEFSINLIPHTMENTSLGTLAVGDEVNLEVDLIARYVARMLGKD